MPPLMVIALVGIAVLVVALARLEGNALFGPSRTTRVRGAAQSFCLDHCRTPEGACPLGLASERCPLWQFVAADLPADQPVDPFRELGGAPVL